MTDAGLRRTNPRGWCTLTGDGSIASPSFVPAIDSTGLGSLEGGSVTAGAAGHELAEGLADSTVIPVQAVVHHVAAST